MMVNYRTSFSGGYTSRLLRLSTAAVMVVAMVTGSVGCGDETQEAVVAASVPAGGTEAIVLPPEVQPADGCSDVACCETQLGITSNECLTIEVVQGQCAVVVADDGTSCTADAGVGCGAGEAQCLLGQCVAGSPGTDCSELEVGACEEAYCDGDVCATRPVTDGTACDDDDLCNGAETCQAGTCTAGTPPECDGDGPCTVAACDPAVGCVTQPQEGKPCSDGNPCTFQDLCDDTGACAPGESFCECETDEQCAGKSDPCTGALTCVEGLCEPTGDALDCDDGNDCTDDSCVEGVGCSNTPNSATCDDDNPCTDDDVCAAGECAGAAVDCDDQDACTDGDFCDETTGECVPGDVICGECETAEDCGASPKCGGAWKCESGQCVDAGQGQDCSAILALPCHAVMCDVAAGGCAQLPVIDGESCDDGSACTQQTTCQSGQCVGIPVVCDDGNPCTADTCDPSTGCKNSPLSGDPCDDSNACTSSEACLDGACVAGGVTDCDDGNPCTEDLCDSESGCESTITPGVACEDGDTQCTTGDTCDDQGVCQPGENQCPCQTDEDCGDDDGNACNGQVICAEGTCQIDPSSVVVCDPSENPCQNNVCDPATGVCGAVAAGNGGPCDDSNACTTGDSCSEGTCQGSAKVCDDGNACTADSCDEGTGCVYAPTDADCDDGNACTVGEACQPSGKCAGGEPADCDDGNLCTADVCLPSAGCKYSPASGLCDDGDLCTSDDFCLQGQCKGTAKTCAAPDACSTAACDATSGQCVAEAIDCGDGNECTVDFCDPEAGCQYEDRVCESDDPCIVPSCDPNIFGGCVETNTVCDDEDPCTDDHCGEDGECAYTPTTCDDDNACTEDTCGETGCVFEAIDCDDDDACTDDGCVAESGECENIAKVCNDDSMCTTDSCEDGDCVYEPVVCDDGEVCTVDSCEAGSGCAFAEKNCDDGVACTVDSCSDGECQFEPFHLECDDGNACTEDLCLADGCSNEALDGTDCDDGEACTADDTCVAGTCEAGTWSCGPCVDKADGTACNDNNAATVADMCLNQKCAGFLTYKGAVTGAGSRPWLRHVRYAQGGFYVTGGDVAGASGPGLVTERGWVGRLGANGDVEVVADSIVEDAAWTQLAGDVVVSDGGHVLMAEANSLGGAVSWSTDNWLQDAFDAVDDVSSLRAAWGRQTSDGGLYFLAGRDNNESWILRCNGTTATCVHDTVTYEDFPQVEVPRQMTGWTTTNENGGASTELVLVADFPTGNAVTPYYNDAMSRGGVGPNGAWSLDLFDNTFSAASSRDVSGTSRFNGWWVGTAGLLRARSPSTGDWLDLTSAVPGQGSVDFNGVWAGEDAVLIAADKVSNQNKVALNLYVHPTSTPVDAPSGYSLLTLATVDAVSCSGVICPSAGAVAASIEDIWVNGDDVVVVGWVIIDGTITTMHFIRHWE